MSSPQGTESDHPVISVVMPTYRRPEMMLRAVRSVLAQSFRDFELIIVDDNHEGHPQQLETQRQLEAGIEDERVRYVINRAEHGGSAARNTGIGLARGGCIAFLDDDEDWLPEKLEKQMALMADAGPDVGVVDAGFYDWKSDGSVRQARPKMSGWILESLLSKTGGRAPKLSTMLCRREVFEQVGVFDTQLPARQDYDLYIRIARKYRFQSIEEPLSNKRADAEWRVTSDPTNLVKGFEGVYRKIRLDLESRPQVHAIYLLKYAEVLANAGNKPQAWSFYRQAAALHWLNARLITYGLKILRA